MLESKESSSKKRKRSLKKGYEAERNVCKKLQERGFIFDRAERSMRVIPQFNKPPCPTCHRYLTFTITKKHDTFERFDIVAKYPPGPDFTYYFQVTVNYWKYGKDRIKIEEFPAGELDVVCMVRKMDRYPFEIKIWDSREKKWREDSFENFLNSVTLDDFLPK